jgi:hypothetical protein
MPGGRFGYVLKKVARLSALASDAIKCIFETGYRIRFVNFWLSGEAARAIWFFPLIEDAIRLRDPGKRCRISDLRPHVLLASVIGDARKIDRVRGKCKVFFSGECVRPREHSDWQGYADYRADSFDLALGFDPETSVARSNYLRLPLWILYYFSSRDSKDEIAAKVRALNARGQSKTKFCAIVARHDSGGIRAEIVDAVASIGPVDSAGSWRNNDDSLARDFGDDKIAYLGRYRFTICPENTQGEGYVTEKLFQAFEAGCIPIYNGYSDDPEPEVIDKDALIFWKEGEGNLEALRKIRLLNSDPTAYREFIARSPLKESAVDFVWDSIQRVRDRVGELVPIRTKRSMKVRVGS